MPAVRVTVVKPKTRLISPRVAPMSASTGLSSTLNAYSVPNGKLMIVAATRDAALRLAGFSESLFCESLPQLKHGSG